MTEERPVRRALVLGGAGFLGGWVTHLLRQAHAETIVLGYGAEGPDDIPLEITRDTVDLALRRSQYDAVFFLAGSPSVPRSVANPSQDLYDNTSVVIDVLEVIRTLPSPPVLLLASSAAVYGDAQRDPMDENHPLCPRSPYGISKLAAEQYVRLYAETYDVPALSVRPFSVYGPGQRKLVVYDLTRRLLTGEDPLVVNSPAEVARDFVYVEDVAQAMLALASRAPAVGEAYNIASGLATTLRDLVDHLIDAAGVRSTPQFTGLVRVGDPLRWRGAMPRAAELCITCPTSLSDGLRETVDWIHRDMRKQ